MQRFRAIVCRLSYIAFTFFAMILLGILIVHWHPQVAQASGDQVTVTVDAITLAAGQTVTLQFTQPGVYHLMSTNTGGTATITVTP